MGHQLPTADEMTALAQALDQIGVAGDVRLTVAPGSPWLSVDVLDFSQGVVRFALWRHTRAVYRLGPDGAVEDDPFYRPDMSLRSAHEAEHDEDQQDEQDDQQ